MSGLRALRAVVVIAALLCAAPLGADAQPAAKVPRIGVLELTSESANAEYFGAFRQALRELGRVDGQNIEVDYHSADGHPDRFGELAAELVRRKVDVIVTRGSQAALAAKYATSTIPIVMATSGDPAAEGIVRNLTRPGGNITGFHIIAPPAVAARRLQLLKEMVPALAHVSVLWTVPDINPVLLMRETEKTARAMGVRFSSVELQRPEDLERAFESIMLAQADALVAVEDYLTLAERTRIVEFAAMSRLPVIYGLREFAEAGGLMAYGADRRDLYRRCAGYVDRILNGARPGELPIQPPSRFELVINVKTARALGLTVPPSLLQRADHVIDP